MNYGARWNQYYCIGAYWLDPNAPGYCSSYAVGEVAMRGIRYGWLSILGVLAPLTWAPGANAACTDPNTNTTGQVAVASKVMGTLSAVGASAYAAVQPTGSPVTGSLSVFSGAGSVTSG